MRSDCLVLGGGIIGCAIAWRLAQRGLRVTLVERGRPGEEASSAAGGILSPQAEAHRPGPFLSLALKSRERYPDLVAELRELVDLDLGFRTDGTLVLAKDDAEAEQLRARARWQTAAGPAVEQIEGALLTKLEPALAPAPLALRFPNDPQIDNRLLVRALAQAAERAGVSFLSGEASGVWHERARVRGVELREEKLAAEKVVVACGSWSSPLAIGLRSAVVEPVRGQMIELKTEPSLLRHVVFGAGGYLVPRKDGRLIVGSTEERVGFVKEVTAAGRELLVGRVAGLIPALAGHPIARSWAGLRPATPDGLPLLGETAIAGLHLATGHFRNGILLTPITAEIVAAQVTGAAPPVDATPFSPARFAE